MPNQQERENTLQSPNKRQKVDTAVNGFNASTEIDNAADLADSSIPLFPRDGKILLLDIEGCTTSISFVHDVLFPFVRANLEKHLEGLSEEKLKNIEESIKNDLKLLDESHPSRLELADMKEGSSIKEMVHALMNHDVKATGLKSLQGDIWKAGYQSGGLKGHVYQDFYPMLQWCKLQGIQVNIYSSGSIGAQKLLFGNSMEGDLLSFLHQHFDTTSGNKKQPSSYVNIAKQLNVDPKEVCFVSDSEAELVAAREAGIGFPIMSVRPGLRIREISGCLHTSNLASAFDSMKL
eukprot:scaffold22593_cov145-Cylindrotheca_fusiformis.AAC.10